MRYRSRTLFHFRFAITLVYYGLALNSDFLSDYYGVHLYFSLQILVDIPGCLAALFLVDRIGRKTVMIGTMMIGCVACIACVFTIVYGGKGNVPLPKLAHAIYGDFFSKFQWKKLIILICLLKKD